MLNKENCGKEFIPAGYEFDSLELLNSHQNKSDKMLQKWPLYSSKTEAQITQGNSITFHSKTHKDYQSVKEISYPLWVRIWGSIAC